MINFKSFFETLTESPVLDIDINNIGDSFDKSTLKFINNPEFTKIIKQGWSKTTHNFDIKFLGGEHTEEFKNYGMLSSSDIAEKLGITPNKDAITVVFTNNKGSELKPITPWIAAHRFGHSLRESINRGEGLSKEVKWLQTVFVDTVNIYLEVYNLSDKQIKDINQFIRFIKMSQTELSELVNNIGSMRSARTNSIVRPFELFYEIVAQYIINGNVKLNTSLTPITVDGIEQTPNEDMLKGKIDFLETQFNNGMKNLLDRSVGKIFIM